MEAAEAIDKSRKLYGSIDPAKVHRHVAMFSWQTNSTIYVEIVFSYHSLS
jgi:hypothetical protein